MKCISHKTFSAPKRPRKKQIPFRDGSYNIGRRNYLGDRRLMVECHLTEPMTEAEFREVIYVLSKEIRLFFWDEPDKYYLAELFEEVDVDVFPKQVRREFTLPFLAAPFAIGERKTVRFQRPGIVNIDYEGTALTPTFIVLRNDTDFDVVNPTIIATERSTG